MKQLPSVSSALYCTPWAILPAVHAELGQLYRSYLSGDIRSNTPAALDKEGRKSSGIRYEANHSERIAVVYVDGIIAKHSPDMLCGPPIADLAKLDELLDEVAADDGIDTVVFYLNSPGGCVVGLDETASNMRDLAEDKRLIAYTDYQACSAAYYLAAACDEIYSAPSAIVGSIGTYMAALDSSRAWEMEGFELKLFRVGKLKAIGHPGKLWTQEEEDHLQELTDKTGAHFREWVASRRDGIEESTMEGQWFFGKDAPQGLIDGLHRDLPRLLATLMSSAES